MLQISRSELESVAETCDTLIENDPSIDPFCSRTAWQLSYHDAFAAERPLWFAHDADSFVMLAENQHETLGSYLSPLEDMWGFGSPLVGSDAGTLLSAALKKSKRAALLLGLPLDRTRLTPLLRSLDGDFAFYQTSPTTRRSASLRGGLSGWLDRRSPSFRRNLRSATRRVEAAGIAFRRVANAELGGSYERVLDVEERSWKGRLGTGTNTGPMCSFYSGMWPRLQARDQLRLLFAEREGEAIGYLHGGLVDGRFRGLQMSFDNEERALGLGNVLQLEMLKWLCDAGAESYDLGSFSDYKTRWAEDGLTTFGLLIKPR
jgi:CelD/BcsL family acetyltransferase involved in cellulose biosynthesis